MAQLATGFLLVMVLLFTPQLLVAAQWAYLFRAINTRALIKGFKTGLEIGDALFGGSPAPGPENGKSNNTTYNCPAHGLQAPLRWHDNMGYVVQLGVSSMSYDFLVATANNFVWTDACRTFPTSAAPVPQPCTSEECQQLNKDADRCGTDSRCQYKVQQMMGGYLANSTFTLSNSKPFNLSFGCSAMTGPLGVGYNSVAGLGRGPLSLISQLQVPKFSYCFTNYSDASLSSQMFFGSYADLDLDEGSSVATTPFQLSPNNNYYVKLIGILVGGTIVPNTAPVVIDSSTALTYLESNVYAGLRSALISYMLARGSILQNAPPYDLCFYPWPDVMPEITFNFYGAIMKLPIRNYLFSLTVSGGSLICLAMLPNVNLDRSYAEYSILGNFQQQNIQFIYDLQNGTLSFRSVDCNGIQPRTISANVDCASPNTTSNNAGVQLSGSWAAALLPAVLLLHVCSLLPVVI